MGNRAIPPVHAIVQPINRIRQAFRINGLELSGAQPFAAFQQQIEYLLAGGEPPTLEVAADSFRSLGAADAPVVITEFSDYQ